MHETVARFEVKVSSELAFGITFFIVFCVIAIQPFLTGRSVRQWAVTTAVIILVVTIVRPKLLVIPNRIWFRFGLLLGSVVSQIVMFTLFILAVTPTGIVMRVFRSSVFTYRRNPNPVESTYWVLRDPSDNSMGSLHNQF